MLMPEIRSLQDDDWKSDNENPIKERENNQIDILSNERVVCLKAGIQRIEIIIFKTIRIAW